MRLSFGLFSFLLLAAVADAAAQRAEHVVLISIDGFRPDFYLDERWEASNLRKVMREGVHATALRTVVPSVTYPSHTSLVTGALPARHGVFYNSPRDAANGAWYWEESRITTPTLWDGVRTSGLTSAAIMWPVTVGAPIDYNFPVRRPNRGENGNQLNVTRPFVTPLHLLEEIENATGHVFRNADFSHDNMDRTIATMANHILSTHRPNLMAIHFLSIDHAGHAVGREGPLIRKSLALVDSLVGSVLATIERAGIKEETAVLITGDHGMVTTTSALAPNVWLAKGGLLNGGSASARFHAAGGSAFLYLDGSNDDTALERVKALLGEVPSAEKELFRVVERKELDKLGVDPTVALALAFSRGVVFHPATEGDAVRKGRRGGSHGYFPDFPEIFTGFIAAGPGIHEGGAINGMGVEDVAPLVAALLGIRFSSPDGKIHPAILKK